MFPIAKSVFVIGMIYVPIVPLTYGIRGGRKTMWLLLRPKLIFGQKVNTKQGSHLRFWSPDDQIFQVPMV